jgi:hypothetical protein
MSERVSAHDAVAGFLAAIAIFMAFMAAINMRLTIGGVDLGFHPVTLGVAAVITSLVAVTMGGRSKLLPFAVFFCGACWFIGMVVAIVTKRPLY